MKIIKEIIKGIESKKRIKEAEEIIEKIGEKEKARLCIRIPNYQHEWIKARSNRVKEANGKNKSMNQIITEAIEEYIGLNK